MLGKDHKEERSWTNQEIKLFGEVRTGFAIKSRLSANSFKILICPKTPCFFLLVGCAENTNGGWIPAVALVGVLEDMPELLCWLLPAPELAKPEYWGFHRFTANWCAADTDSTLQRREHQRC